LPDSLSPDDPIASEVEQTFVLEAFFLHFKTMEYFKLDFCALNLEILVYVAEMIALFQGYVAVAAGEMLNW